MTGYVGVLTLHVPACQSRPGSQYPEIPNSTEEDECGRVWNPFVYKLNGSAEVRLSVSCLSNNYVNFKHRMSRNLSIC